jgi:hypothetical protein
VKLVIHNKREAILILADFLSTKPEQGNHKFSGWWVQDRPSKGGGDRPGIRFSSNSYDQDMMVCFTSLHALGFRPTVNGDTYCDIDISERAEARLLAIMLLPETRGPAAQKLHNLAVYVEYLLKRRAA